MSEGSGRIAMGSLGAYQPKVDEDINLTIGIPVENTSSTVF